jgi:electron transport complex protein RnfD
MSTNGFLNSSAPHIWNGLSVNKIMFIVLCALCFPTAAGVYFFGPIVLLVIAVSIVTGVLTEYVVKKIRKMPFVMDGSTLVTTLIFALILPPATPLWIVALGSIFAIAVVKEAFEGIGFNVFNPALGGRLFLHATFDVHLTTWVMPENVHALSTATPLAEKFVWQNELFDLYKELFLGNIGGSIGETSKLFIFLGAALLLVFRLIDWRAPLAYIGIVAIIAFAFGQDPILNVLSGGLMFAAVFMATDYVTTPITRRGRIIFGVGAGILTMLFRITDFKGMPEGITIALLTMNALTPLIDKYIKVKPYGLKR